MSCPKIDDGEARGLAFWAANKAGENTDDLQNVLVSHDNCEINFKAWNPWPWPDSSYRLVRGSNSWNLEAKVNYIWGGTGGCYGDPYDEDPSYMDKGVSIPACTDWHYELDKPGLFEEEQEYIGDNGYRIVADEKVTAKTRNFYFGVLADKINEVTSFFGIENPHTDLAALFIIDGAVHPGVCGHVNACAGGSGIFLKLSESEFILFNELAIQGNVYNEPTFVHEVSHFVRNDIAAPGAALEEGLAEYAAYNIVNRKKVPEDMSALVFADHSTFGTEIWLEERASEFIEKLIVLQRPEGGVDLVFSLKKPVKEAQLHVDMTQHLDIDEAGLHVLFDLLLNFVDLEQNEYFLKIYKRTEKDGFYKDARDDQIRCMEDGFIIYNEILTDEGFQPVHEKKEPYVNLGVAWPEKDGRAPYYKTSFCFWDILREEYGHEVVAGMVQSMVEFSKLHADTHDYVPFPFFDTFIDLSGMERSEASAYFDRFGVSTKDGDFLIGQYCE